MTEIDEDDRRKGIRKESIKVLALCVIAILSIVALGDLEASQKVLIFGLSALSGLLLFIGFKLRKGNSA